MTVPGSGFGQKAGTHHLRITNLIADTKEMENVLDKMNKFTKTFLDGYK